jgi:hypothetical protein
VAVGRGVADVGDGVGVDTGVAWRLQLRMLESDIWRSVAIA